MVIFCLRDLQPFASYLSFFTFVDQKSVLGIRIQFGSGSTSIPGRSLKLSHWSGRQTPAQNKPPFPGCQKNPTIPVVHIWRIYGSFLEYVQKFMFYTESSLNEHITWCAYSGNFCGFMTTNQLISFNVKGLHKKDGLQALQTVEQSLTKFADEFFQGFVNNFFSLGLSPDHSVVKIFHFLNFFSNLGMGLILLKNMTAYDSRQFRQSFAVFFLTLKSL